MSQFGETFKTTCKNDQFHVRSPENLSYKNTKKSNFESYTDLSARSRKTNYPFLINPNI